MGDFSAEFAIAGVNSADGVLFNLKTNSTSRAMITEVFFGIETAPTNPPQFGFKRMNAVGTGTITNATTGLHDVADGGPSAVLETAWATTRPTVTGGSFGRGVVPLALGNGFLFDFTNRPLVVPLSAGLCGLIRNATGATVGAFGGHVRWRE